MPLAKGGRGEVEIADVAGGNAVYVAATPGKAIAESWVRMKSAIISFKASKDLQVISSHYALLDSFNLN